MAKKNQAQLTFTRRSLDTELRGRHNSTRSWGVSGAGSSAIDDNGEGGRLFLILVDLVGRGDGDEALPRKTISVFSFIS